SSPDSPGEGGVVCRTLVPPWPRDAGERSVRARRRVVTSYPPNLATRSLALAAAGRSPGGRPGRCRPEQTTGCHQENPNQPCPEALENVPSRLFAKNTFLS